MSNHLQDMNTVCAVSEVQLRAGELRNDDCMRLLAVFASVDKYPQMYDVDCVGRPRVSGRLAVQIDPDPRVWISIYRTRPGHHC